MNFDEVVREIVWSRCCRVIPQLGRESIAQARVATHRCADCPVLAFHIACAEVLRISVTSDNFHVVTDTYCWHVAFLILILSAIDFLQFNPLWDSRLVTGVM